MGNPTRNTIHRRCILDSPFRTANERNNVEAVLIVLDSTFDPAKARVCVGDRYQFIRRSVPRQT